MDNRFIYTGDQIRHYRQARGLSLTELANLIHKSKATMSKYEKGQICIDIGTMYEIADVLGVPLSHFLVPDTKNEIWNDRDASSKSTRYLYSAARGKLTRSVLQHFTSKDGKTVTVDFYYDVPSFDQLEGCRGLYEGTMSRQGTVYNYQFVNVKNSTEHTFLCCLESLDNNGYNMGLLSSISSTTMFPNAIKVVMSPKKLSEGEALMEVLKFDKDDISRMKKDNMLSIRRR